MTKVDHPPLTTFRVHFADGVTVDVDAETPPAAREIARRGHIGNITKVKVVKEKADG